MPHNQRIINETCVGIAELGVASILALDQECIRRDISDTAHQPQVSDTLHITIKGYLNLVKFLK